jgi:HPt (histidine-containing phosphotransfer) domain-containing protein
LRIIPVWQALGAHAAQAKRTRIHCNQKHNFDEMTVTFTSISPADLTEITRRLNTQKWVVSASLHTALSSSPEAQKD